MSSEVSSCTVESAVFSGLDFEETELKLALPGRADGERKRGFSETVDWEIDAGRPAVPVEKAVAKTKAPAAKAQVVGWPPVRSTWKNAMKSCKYVKVAVDGTPYLRKVNLEIYGSYQQLLTALEEMFSCFSIRNYLDERRLVDSMNGTEYVPTYEDREGDWMLVGDVPWKMFVDSCKRIRLMKSSDAVNLAAPRTPQRSSNAE